jgi:phage shock protein A
MAATERIPLLVTPAQKALFTKRAKASKLTVNEFVRRAAEAYSPSDEDEALIRLVAQVKQTTHEATAALDTALKSCADSNRRIADMEAAHALRSK